ncbi:MAG: penicillin-binding protein, partial [Longicatena sp.]
MNLKRSNRTLFLMTVIMGIIGTLIISNVLFTMVTQKHLRSGINVKDFKDADISNTSVVKANRGTIYDRDSEVIAQDEDTFTLVAMMSESRVGINNVPAYVQNITKTARLLAPKLGMNE